MKSLLVLEFAQCYFSRIPLVRESKTEQIFIPANFKSYVIARIQQRACAEGKKY